MRYPGGVGGAALRIERLRFKTGSNGNYSGCG